MVSVEYKDEFIDSYTAAYLKDFAEELYRNHSELRYSRGHR